MWWRNSRLDRIEANQEQIQANMQQMEASIQLLVEISAATNRRIDRYIETAAQQIPIMQEQIQVGQARTEQLQRAVEYFLSRDGS